jgi:hypothetical protein
MLDYTKHLARYRGIKMKVVKIVENILSIFWARILN